MEALPYVTTHEREMAMNVLVRNHQNVHLLKLKLKKDEHGLLRCQGRLGNANLPINTRQPFLLATKTELARLVVEDAHLPLHCSVSQTIARVREKFWIPKIRQMARTVIKRCLPCQKVNNLPYKYPDMDDFSERRVQKTRQFEHAGIDYFGPLSVKHDEELKKAYGIILTPRIGDRHDHL
ncbi:hypothetical protein RB195_014097 [Necator americanus]|uniref:Integrase zinc-binding domain-containing protein n=1 Tax=Necator americanus TaxID=51031 RepID=A0ABR1DYL8_NECAM